MKAVFFSLAGLLLLGQPVLGQEVGEDVISIPKLVQLCESCHGQSGVSERSDVPSLAGESVDSIMEDMNKFYFQRRHCPATTPVLPQDGPGAALDMCHISGSLTQVEKMALAEHFSSLAPPDN